MLAPGVCAELVACEPLVRDPVAAVFDGDGRLWVVEMSGFMPDVDGKDELEPSGAIAVLEDEDGDGRMDRRSVFLDGLVLPRAVLPTRGGALVLAPPELLFCRDEDGDGRADERSVVERGFEAGLHNPEHAANGLLPALDNWIVCANHDARYRWRNGVWERRRSAGGGQWGIAQDDLGRLYFNTNSDPLRGARIDPYAAARNLNLGVAEGANEQLTPDFRVWPVRITPGVNRGYQPGFLVDWKLKEFTAACAPLVYREHALPAEYHGDAFVCEPAANLIKHFRLEAGPDGARASNAREGTEFLASTDERFRPVNLCAGPDGAMYVVDMYRGLIQHRNFVTTFLRRQVVARSLDQPTGLGRIWRVTSATAARNPGSPRLSSAAWSDLVALLSHADGWWRDAAQRELVERGLHAGDAEPLRKLARQGKAPLGRVHALWALEGLDAIDADTVMAALGDADDRVRLASVRCSEALLRQRDDSVLEAILEAAGASQPLRRQAALSLGESQTPAGLASLASLLQADASSSRIRSAALSGLGQRELDFLRVLLAADAWRDPQPGRPELLRDLARCVVQEGRSDRVDALLAGLAEEPVAWRRQALREGTLAGRPKGPDGKPGYIPLARKPEAFDSMPEDVRVCLLWPGRADVVQIRVVPLSADEQARFESGRHIYAMDCATCHQASGLGEPGKAPPLRYTDWTLGSKDRLVRILLHGLTGPLQVNGTSWSLEMPSYAADDERIAAVLTYIRREWGHGAAAVSPEEVKVIRAATAGRDRQWTIEELERVP
ncbi:MAG: c-type cytochrome [Planctomycetota bacterium]|nr:MAG: c-type cytochrome [Planctomycetota bacterium]